ncbi:MAG: PadR family transcriptional regulator [Omnitrophica WOR_2 bacterium]
MSDSESPVKGMLPLREPTFFILLSLAPCPKHGYAILKDVEELSGSKIRLSTGTLYEALARLLDQNLIERVDLDAGGEELNSDPHPGKPRKAYCLTHAGRRILEAEIGRMQFLISAARRRLGEECS